MWCLSYPVRWHGIALSTLLTALQSIPGTWFGDHITCISLRRIEESARTPTVLDVDGQKKRLHMKNTHAHTLDETET